MESLISNLNLATRRAPTNPFQGLVGAFMYPFYLAPPTLVAAIIYTPNVSILNWSVVKYLKPALSPRCLFEQAIFRK